MARFKKKAGAGPARETQLSLLARIDELTRRVEERDPEHAANALFFIALALMGIGLLVQATAAATTIVDGEEFAHAVRGEVLFRVLALVVLLVAARIGTDGLRRLVPVLVVLVVAMLVAVFVPPLAAPLNHVHRWLRIPFVGLTFQPSELARVVLVLWVADRCMRLGPAVRDVRKGVLPILTLGLAVFGLILVETDVGGSLLYLICFLCTMWVGGARPVHVAGSLLCIGGGAIVVALSSISHVRERIALWMGQADNAQVHGALAAMASGDFFGVGLGHGLYRNSRVPYLESDYAFALIGEEFGFFGLVMVLGLLLAFTWYSLKLVLSIKSPYSALAAFGLLISVALQAMLHVQVVTGLAPPKGMTLPFVSNGGTSLVVSSLAIGLAIGAARSQASGRPNRRESVPGFGARRASLASSLSSGLGGLRRLVFS